MNKTWTKEQNTVYTQAPQHSTNFVCQCTKCKKYWSLYPKHPWHKEVFAKDDYNNDIAF